MNYLFFDIECCDGKHICEFGYVLINESFEILERDCLLINPDKPFDLSGRSGSKDISLHFTEAEYYAAPRFPDVYDRIYQVIYREGQTIIGFSISNDIKFLKTACRRYAFPKMFFRYYDFQSMYRAWKDDKNDASVERIVKELGIGDIVLHKSDEDALAVMLALKTLSQTMGLPLTELLVLLLEKEEAMEKERLETTYHDIIEALNDGNYKAQKDIIRDIREELEDEPSEVDAILGGKRICFAEAENAEAFNLALGLIKALHRIGASFTADATACDIFVTTPWDEVDSFRLDKAKQSAERGYDVTFMTQDALLDALGLTAESLTENDHIKTYVHTFRPHVRYAKKRHYDPAMLVCGDMSNGTIGSQMKKNAAFAAWLSTLPEE